MLENIKINLNFIKFQEITHHYFKVMPEINKFINTQMVL